MTETSLPIAPDVHLIRSLPDGGGPVRVAVNSLVITGPEPVLVDTGATTGRDEWWQQVEGVVDPADVRWIFISHDDIDHYGNLLEALDRCPDAVLVTSWFLGQRLASYAPLPLDRCRWLNDRDTLVAGDRRLVAIRPPAYDSPTTRGLLDVTSGVYWASDCFGVPVPHQVDEVADLDRDAWEEGSSMFHRLLSPWATTADPVRWRQAVARLGSLDLQAVAGAHGPVIGRRDVPRALELLGDLPGLPEVEAPGQAQLEATLAAMTAVTAA